MAFPPQAPTVAESVRDLELAAWARERAPQLDEEGRAWTMSDLGWRTYRRVQVDFWTHPKMRQGGSA